MTTDPDGAAATLVVGHSDDPTGDHALVVAADLGRRLHARLHVVHVIEAGDYPADSDAADWEAGAWQQLAVQRRRVEQMLTETGLPWSYETRRGDPASVLAAVAEEHDVLLIVVGTRGEGLRVVIPRLIEPSVSHGLIRCQPRPVLIVPAPATDSRAQ